MVEEWRDIPGYEGIYQISNIGRLRSLARTFYRSGDKPSRVKWREKILNGTVSNHGYVIYNLRKGCIPQAHTAHSLVALVFIGPRPDGLDIRHLDGNKQNNRVSNLKYGTRSENMRDEVRLGRNNNAAKTHCPRGHDLSGGNLKIGPGKRGFQQRSCRNCNSMHFAVRNAKVRDARLNPEERAVIQGLRKRREAATLTMSTN